jgi:riboflavin kinase/FMN adenylyltransferase
MDDKRMTVVAGVDALRPEHGPLVAVVGVFDGLHRGHAYLLEHLVAEAKARDGRPTVITFDHHPDEVLTGHAPPLLLDPTERLDRLAAAGVEVIVVQHFDEAVRRTTYDAFVAKIQARTRLAALVMTPDAAFGYERRGTPEALAALGAETGFDVVVVPPFELGDRSVRSSEVRAAIEAGDLELASTLLGRPVTIAGEARPDTDGVMPMTFAWPMALPPDGRYAGRTERGPCVIGIEGGQVRLEDAEALPPPGRVVVELGGDAGGPGEAGGRP